MKCLNCGYCCIELCVVIIKPEYVKPDLDLSLVDCLDDDFLTLKHSNELCPHIIIRDKKFMCGIHHYEWYKDTPCYQYVQVENNKDELCRMGDMIINQKKFANYIEFKTSKEKNK